MKALVVGGTSGLGFEMAKQLWRCDYDKVIITGRTDPKEDGLIFVRLPLDSKCPFLRLMDQLVDSDDFDTVIYNPGFYQEGLISDLSDEQIVDMVTVGFFAAAVLMQRILKKQGSLGGFVAITSTSQWTPRRLEPVYAGVKAGLGMLANSLSLDERIARTIVAAPSEMKTKFWDGTSKNTFNLLEPEWVAQQILGQLFASEDFRYRCVHILRDPPRVDIVETRE